MIDVKTFYRREVMELLNQDHLRITDNVDHIIFEQGLRKAVFSLDDSKLLFYFNGEFKVDYEIGRVFIMFAVKRMLTENFLA